VVGAGHIGSALLAYTGFEQQGFDIVAVFDSEDSRVGQVIDGRTVRPVSEIAGSEGWDMGVIATPVRAAQDVADALVAAGVRGILNFAPRKLKVPEWVALRTVDMTMEFESLSFALSQPRPGKRRRERT